MIWIVNLSNKIDNKVIDQSKYSGGYQKSYLEVTLSWGPYTMDGKMDITVLGSLSWMTFCCAVMANTSDKEL